MPTIKIKGSSTAAAEPLTLAERELAVNVTDKKLYVGDGAAVRKIVGSLGNQEASAVAITGGSIAGITDLAVADGGTGASTAADARTNLGITATGADTTYAFRSNNLSDLASASTARTNLGLGSIATQASSSVSITGGSITGVTDIAIADGGTGASTAADARTNLGLGSIATQSASSVSITGGTISGITDLAVADGGTGASTAADARTNLSVPSTTGSGASGTWGIDISGNAATATSATSATTATNLAGGAANRVPYQSASGTTTFVAAPTVTNSYLKWNGTALGWDTVSGGGGGSGDVVGPASATDNQIVLFDSTTGKLIKAATTTGLLKASTGVIAAAVSGTDYAPATSGSANQLLASNGTGGFTNLTTGTGVVTALGVNTGSSGAFVVNGGALGTPLSGTVTNLTGTASININGTVGATTPSTGAFTTLSASSTVSGAGFSTYLASPPAIGGTAAAAGTFTTLTANGNTTLGDATTDTITLTGTVQPGVVISGSSSGDALRITQTGAGNALLVEDSTNPDSSPFVVDASGNVGIGTTSPAQALHVVSTGNQIKYPLRLQNDGTSGTTLGVGLQYYVYNGTSVANLGAIIGTGSTWSYGTYSANQMSISSSGSGGVRVATASAPITFHTGNADSDLSTERMRLDSSGNLGLGVTPSAWDTTGKALQFGAGAVYSYSTGSIGVFQNATYSDTFRYVNTAAASRYTQTAGQHQWYTAPSGTAGATTSITSGQFYTVTTLGSTTLGQWQAYFSGLSAIPSVGQTILATATGTLAGGATVTQTITFTQAMTLDASGNLVVGNTSANGRIEGVSTSSTYSLVANNSASSADQNFLQFRASSTILGDINRPNATNDIEINAGYGALTFGTGTAGTATERARITSDGNLLVGTTVAPAVNGGGIAIYKSDYPRLTFRNSTSGDTTGDGLQMALVGADFTYDLSESGYQRWTTASTERMRITSVGEVYIAGTTDQGAYNLQVNGTGVWGAGAYVNGSDERLKDNIQTLNDGLAVVLQLRPVTFQYKPEHSKDQSVQPGFIAQELQQAMDGKAYLDGVVQSGPEYLNVAYQNLIPILTKAIQEQQALIASLTARIAALEGTQP